MIISELFHEASSAITVNKVRSGLTVLGIVIGIGSVIAMISIGQGAQSSINERIQSIGSNLIMVTPGQQRNIGYGVREGQGSAQTLTPDDANAIAQLDGIAAAAPQISGRYQIIYKGANTNTNVIGTLSTYAQVRNVDIDQGSFVSDADVAASSKIAVIGPTVLQDLFGGNATATPDEAIGNTIRIKSVNFKIVGVTKSKGGTGFGNQDNIVYVPLTTGQHFLLGSTSYVSEIDIQVQSQGLMSQVQEEVTSLLLGLHNISDSTQADFTVQNQSDIVAAASSVTDTFTILLASIAGISLVVGGIGIMNMMLTTVTERTREIGLRKAIGAKRGDISTQFLLESVMLTFIGGVVGVALGWVFSLLITRFASITTSISLWSVFLAVGVSALVGIVFGYYPARRAAGLNPIEALRYE
jgi:putative ABC transport system permease protein